MCTASSETPAGPLLRSLAHFLPTATDAHSARRGKARTAAAQKRVKRLQAERKTRLAGAPKWPKSVLALEKKRAQASKPSTS